jgi:hypothetical protein
VHRERIDLHPVDLVAGERPRQGVDRDVLWFDIARGLIDLPIQASDFDTATLAPCGAQRRILAEQWQDVQPISNQFLEGDAMVLGDRGQPDVNFVLVILGAEVEGGAWLRHRAKPILCHDVRNVFLQFDDALSGTTFA